MRVCTFTRAPRKRLLAAMAAAVCFFYRRFWELPGRVAKAALKIADATIRAQPAAILMAARRKAMAETLYQALMAWPINNVYALQNKARLRLDLDAQSWR